MKTVSQSLLFHDAKTREHRFLNRVAAGRFVCRLFAPDGTGFRDGFNGGRNRVMRWFISCAQ
jgi:hypothetical protein